jgi:hypothetical protein
LEVIRAPFLLVLVKVLSVSYHALWDVPLDSRETALISSLNVLIGKKVLPKSTTPTIPISLDHADCTFDINNANNHFLTFSCRTSTGKQVMFLRVWAPSQKRFSFRWTFKFVLTGLFDVSVFCRTRLVMVDDDPQQTAELSKAILDYDVPNAVDCGCGWHIVEQGWKAHGPGKTAVRDVGGKHERNNCSSPIWPAMQSGSA